MSAATAGVTIAPGVLLPSTPQGEPETGGAPVWKKTPCRMCGVGCGLLVAIENGRAVAVRGDPDSPVSAGLACAKGYYSVQALYARDRITQARVRRDGALVRAPMGDALDLVASRLRETIRRYGGDSVAVYGSSQWTMPDAYVAAKLFREGLGSNNVETSARLYTAAADAGLRTTFGLDGAPGCYEDIDHADVFVLWDANIAETDPVLFSRMLDRRRMNSAVLIVDLATRTTRTSYAADHSLMHAPHSSIAVANAICHEIVARRQADRDFIDRHVAFKRGRTGIGYGIDDDALLADDPESVAWDDYVAFLEEYSPQRAQALSGVPAERIRWLASLYGDPSRKVMSVWGANASQHARGTWLNNALYNIHLLVGKIASPGNAALSLTEGVPAERSPSRARRTALPLFRAFDRGEIRFLWVQSANPMVTLPNLGRYRRAPTRDDRFLVVSEAYPTPTTDIADVVLPSAMWLEREGICTNMERRVQHFDQMVTPPGDAMSVAGQMTEVARRLGLQALVSTGAGGRLGPIWEDYRRLHDDPRVQLAPLAELRRTTGVMWPVVNGRETKWRYNTSHDPAASRARGAYDFYGHQDGRAWIWLRPQEPPAETPDAAYPFWLSVGPVLEHWGSGSLTRRIPTLHRAVPRAYVEIHRDDARRLGIRSGETVRVSSRRGSLDIEARVDFRSQPQRGQLFVPSFDETLPIRRLMLDSFCPLSGQPDTITCAASVARLPARGGP